MARPRREIRRIAAIIELILSNFTLTFLAAELIAAALSLALRRRPAAASDCGSRP